MDRYAHCIGQQIAWLDAEDHKTDADQLYRAWKHYTFQFPDRQQRAQVTTAYVVAYTNTRATLRAITPVVLPAKQ
jgi:hypothetical protein